MALSIYNKPLDAMDLKALSVWERFKEPVEPKVPPMGNSLGWLKPLIDHQARIDRASELSRQWKRRKG